MPRMVSTFQLTLTPSWFHGFQVQADFSLTLNDGFQARDVSIRQERWAMSQGFDFHTDDGAFVNEPSGMYYWDGERWYTEILGQSSIGRWQTNSRATWQDAPGISGSRVPFDFGGPPTGEGDCLFRTAILDSSEIAECHIGWGVRIRARSQETIIRAHIWEETRTWITGSAGAGIGLHYIPRERNPLPPRRPNPPSMILEPGRGMMVPDDIRARRPSKIARARELTWEPGRPLWGRSRPWGSR
jgi:hypothetical protein